MEKRLRQLSERLPQLAQERPERQAAVAMVLRAKQVLLMQRVERPGDRWSGQISLPGGHRDASDRNLWATAVRETHEEVGLDLAQTARFVGCLPSMQARADGGLLPMWITPFLFVETNPMQPEAGPEAELTFWLPLDEAHSGVLDQPYHWSGAQGLKRELPSWSFGGHVIWGMTYHMLKQLTNQLFEEE